MTLDCNLHHTPIPLPYRPRSAAPPPPPPLRSPSAPSTPGRARSSGRPMRERAGPLLLRVCLEAKSTDMPGLDCRRLSMIRLAMAAYRFPRCLLPTAAWRAARCSCCSCCPPWVAVVVERRWPAGGERAAAVCVYVCVLCMYVCMYVCVCVARRRQQAWILLVVACFVHRDSNDRVSVAGTGLHASWQRSESESKYVCVRVFPNR